MKSYQRLINSEQFYGHIRYQVWNMCYFNFCYYNNILSNFFKASSESVDQLLLSKLGSIEEGTVFDEMIQLLKHMKNDMMSNIVSYIADDTKARSRPYRKDKYV